MKSKNGIDCYETYLRIMLYISIRLRTFNCDRKVITDFDLKNGIYFLQRLFKLNCPIKLRIKQTFPPKFTPSCLTYYSHENYRIHCSSLIIAHAITTKSRFGQQHPSSKMSFFQLFSLVNLLSSENLSFAWWFEIGKMTLLFCFYALCSLTIYIPRSTVYKLSNTFS